jgi:hypothetical protein
MGIRPMGQDATGSCPEIFRPFRFMKPARKFRGRWPLLTDRPSCGSVFEAAILPEQTEVVAMILSSDRAS